MKKAKIPAHIKTYVFSNFQCCVACGSWDSNTCGHIVPEAQGGAMEPSNFVRLCHNCNSVQGACMVNFGAFAPYTIEPAVIISRRAYWAKYCKSAKGTHKIKPYSPL